MSEYMKAAQFKTDCLKVMDRVKKTRRRVIITKHNIPVAQLVPIEGTKKSIFGGLKGTVHFKGDIIAPINEEWDANY